MSFQAMDIEPINASQQSLVRIFSDEFAFAIPPYQRPYAWDEDQARELLTDITSALDDALSTKDPVTYFLGSIVLIKKPGSPNADVVDGQQRLTTLTILLSVLRDLSEGRTATKRHSYICEEGDPDKGTKDRYRLSPRRQDADFFRMSIQAEGATQTLSGEEGASESQKLMVSNADYFRKELTAWSVAKRDDLFAFLVQRCYLVVISVANVDTALRTIGGMLNECLLVFVLLHWMTRLQSGLQLSFGPRVSELAVPSRIWRSPSGSHALRFIICW